MALPALPKADIRLGLRANLTQFTLLALVNAFVGAMVGQERLLPLLAEREFGLVSSSTILAFILTFGLAKAFANLGTGWLTDQVGRKPLLVAGWLIGLPVPILIMVAPDWGWIVAANVLLGINQGLCWSSTVIMKIDLVGPRQRGLAMGLNECAGYLAFAAATWFSGYLAATTALRPQPFIPGLIFALLGLLLSVFFVRETLGHAHHEARLQAAKAAPQPSFRAIFATVSWRDRSLAAVSQAGLVNNLNDALAWGLFPLLFAAQGLALVQIGIIAALYPAVWGIGQLAAGALSDRWGRKWLIVVGMEVQAAAIIITLLGNGFAVWSLGSVLLGIGTAMVYPTLLAAIGDVADPGWRASAVGIYRLWRDLGYVVGALLVGGIADQFGFGWAITFGAAITAASGLLVALRMVETYSIHPKPTGVAGINNNQVDHKVVAEEL